MYDMYVCMLDMCGNLSDTPWAYKIRKQKEINPKKKKKEKEMIFNQINSKEYK